MKTPRQYQVQAIETIKRKNLLLSDECGLGKTLTAIEAAKIVQAQLGKPVLIVIPKTLRDQWTRELVDQGVPIEYITQLDSSNMFTGEVPFCPTWVITHYEALVKHQHTLSKTFWAMVITDEAHRIKNRKTKRTEAIKSLKAYRKVAMTGTPFDKNPADIWSILQWLEPQTFTSYWNFFEAHVNYQEILVGATKKMVNGKLVKVGGRKVKQIIASKPIQDPAKFARLVRQYSMKRTKKEVRSDLPERIDQFIDIEMNDDQNRYYNTLANSESIIADLTDDVAVSMPIILTRVLRLIQATTDPTLLGVDSSSAKLDWVRDWVDDNEEESVIIFTRFRATAERLAKELPGFTLLVGGTKRPKIDASVTRIVGTIAAMGEGLDLPHIDHAIFIDVEWSSILMTQAIDRIHRINIETVKHIYYLRCAGSIDETVYNAIMDKWDTKTLVDQLVKGLLQEQNQ